MSFYPDWAGFDVTAHLRDRVAFLFGDATPVERALSTPELRRELCVDDPLLFAWIYLGHHLVMPDTGEISFAVPHIEWYDIAREWTRRSVGIAEWRHAFIAPRSCGKSSVWFLAIPMWGLAMRHVSFVVAFANTPGQAEQHLSTFKRELDNNNLLRSDFPELCQPMVRPKGTQVADRQGMLHTKSGAVFAAKGVDSASLGMKVGAQRPDVIILDDLEPDEARYSALLKEKRLGTLLDAILPLNVAARVAMVGTVTMPGSITHDLVRATATPDRRDAPEWVRMENFTAHHHRPFTVDADGNEISIWPEKWPTEWLMSRRHTREFAKNMENDPLARDGDYWTLDDFTYGELPHMTGCLLSIDPAVTTNAKSDFTALSVIGYYAPERKAVVRDAWAIKVAPGDALRKRVMDIIENYPQIRGVLVEVNQGGAAWQHILRDVGRPVKTVHQHLPKEVRAAKLLNHYQSGRVLHEKRLPGLEAQMVSFPKGLNDDLVDSVSSGVAVFLDQAKRPSVKTASYV